MLNPDNITIVAQPETVQRGELLQIHVAITSAEGLSVVVPRVYMEIVDSAGRIVWPRSVIEKDSSGFTKLISTAELKTNTRYTIRAAINNKMIRQSFAFFKTAKTAIPPSLIPIGMGALALVPKSYRDVVYLVYATELDARVCDICKPHEGKRFRPNDPNLIRIGPPELGGQTHYNCRCHYLAQGVLNAALLKAQNLRAVALAAAATKHKGLEMYQRS